MFLKYLAFTWKYLLRHPLFSLINMAGLVIGITGALFIYIYCSYQLSFDRFHEDYERIYRLVGIDNNLGISSNQVGITMPPLAPVLEAELPEVEESVRYRAQGEALIGVGDRLYYADNLAYTEDSFFDLFDYPLLRSISGPLLDRPRSAIVTAEFGRILFGDEDPLGRTVRLNNDQDLEIVGVMANNRSDSHLQFDLLVALEFLGPDDENSEQLQRFLGNWGMIAMPGYIRLAAGADAGDVASKVSALVEQRATFGNFSATIQPLKDVHLDSADILFDGYNRNKGDAMQVYMLASVAVFLLLIAAFNYMNLSTARSTLRSREVGIHKASGATRWDLARLFLLESFLLVGISTILSLGLLTLLEPLVSLPLEVGFLQYLLQNGAVIALGAALLVLLALLAGSWPAFVLSSFSPTTVLKAGVSSVARGLWLRRLLVVLQFGFSIVIIIGMLVVGKQLDFMRTMNPGFERDGIVNITLTDQVTRGANYDALLNLLRQAPGVVSVGGSSNMPGQTFGRGGIGSENTPPGEFTVISRLVIDDHFLDTLSMNLVEGRGYSSEYPADMQQSVLLNQSAVRALGWEDGANRTVLMGGQPRTVVGVVEDFHFASLRHQIEPVVLLKQESGHRILSIRIDRAQPRLALDGIRDAWEQINPDYPFEYSFFTEEYNRLMQDDETFSSLLNQFTFIAILIACLGLYGLASFTAERKTREISIRKVLGAGPGHVMSLVLFEYGVLILAANALAWTAAYIFVDNWLAAFAYRIDMSWSSFLLASVGTTLLAILTVSGEVGNVVRSKPAYALRSE